MTSPSNGTQGTRSRGTSCRGTTGSLRYRITAVWVVLVTVADDGTLLDRRPVELVDENLPKIPRHSEGQALPLHEAPCSAALPRISSSSCHEVGPSLKTL